MKIRLKRILYKFLYVKKDVDFAVRNNNYYRISLTIPEHLKDIFEREYHKAKARL